MVTVVCLVLINPVFQEHLDQICCLDSKLIGFSEEEVKSQGDVRNIHPPHIRSSVVRHRLCGSVDTQLQLIVVAPCDSKRIMKQTKQSKFSRAPRSTAPEHQQVAGTSEALCVMCRPVSEADT